MAAQTQDSRRRRRGTVAQMTLSQHLRELRRRLTFAAIAIVIGMIIAFIVTDPVIYLMTEPIRVIARQRGDDFAALNFDSVTAGFDLRMRMAFAIGLIISAPGWLWQIWAFIVPGLTRKERRYSIAVGCAAGPLFFAGCAVGWWMMPHIIEMLSAFVPAGASQFYNYSYYYDFVFKLMLVVGIAFVLPVFLVVLNTAGILSAGAILHGWRIAAVASCVFAAAATPSADVVSMLVLALILVGLYFAAAAFAFLFERRARARTVSFNQL